MNKLVEYIFKIIVAIVTKRNALNNIKFIEWFINIYLFILLKILNLFKALLKTIIYK